MSFIYAGCDFEFVSSGSLIVCLSVCVTVFVRVCLSVYICVQKLLQSCLGNLDSDKKLQLAKCGSQTDHKRRTCMGCYACCECPSFMLAVILSSLLAVIVCVSVCVCLSVCLCISLCVQVCLCVCD